MTDVDGMTKEKKIGRITDEKDVHRFVDRMIKEKKRVYFTDERDVHSFGRLAKGFGLVDTQIIRLFDVVVFQKDGKIEPRVVQPCGDDIYLREPTYEM